MKIKIGDKVYLQKYEVLRFVRGDAEAPMSILYECCGDDCLVVNGPKDSFDFDCCFTKPENVSWLMKQNYIVDYDEYINVDVDSLRKLMKRLMCEHNDLIDSCKCSNSEHTDEQRENLSRELQSYKWKMSSISIMIDLLEGKRTFTYPDEYTGTRYEEDDDDGCRSRRFLDFIVRLKQVIARPSQDSLRRDAH